MLKNLIALMVITTPMFASDTVWVETSFQKKARQYYEAFQRGYEEEGESLRNARSIINSLRPKPYHETNLSEILEGRRTDIVITVSDKQWYLMLIKSRLDTLKALYAENEQVLNILVGNLRSGPYYVQIDKMSSLYEKIGVARIDSLAAIKECSALGEFYDWPDWLMLKFQRTVYKKTE